MNIFKQPADIKHLLYIIIYDNVQFKILILSIKYKEVLSNIKHKRGEPDELYIYSQFLLSIEI